MEAWERDYQPRQWKTYVLPIRSPEEPETTPESDLKWCNSDSEMARRWGNKPDRFYPDWELTAAGLDPLSGTLGFARLTKPWRGHPAGALAIAVFDEGLNADPPTYTWMVEVPPEA